MTHLFHPPNSTKSPSFFCCCCCCAPEIHFGLLCLSSVSTNQHSTKSVRVRQTDRDRERVRQTERDRERQRQRETERHAHTHTCVRARTNTQTHNTHPHLSCLRDLMDCGIVAIWFTSRSRTWSVVKEQRTPIDLMRFLARLIRWSLYMFWKASRERASITLEERSSSSRLMASSSFSTY